jgi:hypothetical protein
VNFESVMNKLSGVQWPGDRSPEAAQIGVVPYVVPGRRCCASPSPRTVGAWSVAIEDSAAYASSAVRSALPLQTQAGRGERGVQVLVMVGQIDIPARQHRSRHRDTVRARRNTTLPQRNQRQCDPRSWPTP